MENASKALIIAGAILVAILLISIGILVINSTSKVTDNMDDVTASQGAQTVNSKFEPYLGTNRNYSSTRSLIEACKSYESEAHKVELTGITNVTGLEAGKTYKCEAEYEKGYIISIDISEDS